MTGLFIGTVVVVGTLLQFSLVFEGALTLGRAILRWLFPSLPMERPGWFAHWGAWHLVVIMLMMRFYGDEFRSQFDASALTPFDWSAFQAYQLYVIIPTTLSFIMSHVHMYFLIMLQRR